MAHVGTQLTPFGISTTVGKLNQVECIVNIGLQIINGYMELFAVVLELTGQSHADHGQRSGTDFL